MTTFKDWRDAGQPTMFEGAALVGYSHEQNSWAIYLWSGDSWIRKEPGRSYGSLGLATEELHKLQSVAP